MNEATALTLHQDALPIPLAGSLETYIRRVSSIPLLDVEEERALAVRLYQQGDVAAAQKLIVSNLRFVVHVARGYAGYGLQLADLIQEGNVGLMKAVKRFDPEVGVRLISFAVHWIRAEIHEFILRNWRIVKIATTKEQRKLFFNLRGAKKRLGWMNKSEVEAVASDLNVKPETVLEMEDRLSGHDLSFNAVSHDDGDDDAAWGPESYLEADRNSDPAYSLTESQFNEHKVEQMQTAMQSLDARSRDILQKRWLVEDNKAGLQELANEYGVSAERIRQLESAALKKLRSSLAA